MAEQAPTTPERGMAGWIGRTLDTRRGGTSHVDALDGIRGVAVGMVFFVHYHPWIGRFLPAGGSMHELSARLADIGNAGVDLFFVLSGYLIYGGLLRRPQPFATFMQRRLQRLYPTFLVVFIPVLLIELARGAPTLQSGAGLIPNLVGNVTLLAGFLPFDPLIVVAWTLSWEIVFYLLTPAVFHLARLSERTRPQRLVIVSVLWGALSISGAIRGVGNARILMFLGGVAVAEWAEARRGKPDRDPRRLRAIATVAAVAVPVASFALTYGGTYRGEDIVYGSQGWAAWLRLVMLFVTLPIIVAALIDGRGALASFVSRGALRGLGIISYSYYLIHALVIRFLGEAAIRLIEPTQHRAGLWWWVALVPTFAATTAAAFLLFALVERPCSIDSDPPVTVIPPRIHRWPWQRHAAMSSR